jgi:N-acetylglucosamine-6-phosphate deacetylase
VPGALGQAGGHLRGPLRSEQRLGPFRQQLARERTDQIISQWDQNSSRYWFTVYFGISVSSTAIPSPGA